MSHKQAEAAAFRAVRRYFKVEKAARERLTVEADRMRAVILHAVQLVFPNAEEGVGRSARVTFGKAVLDIGVTGSDDKPLAWWALWSNGGAYGFKRGATLREVVLAAVEHTGDKPYYARARREITEALKAREASP